MFQTIKRKLAHRKTQIKIPIHNEETELIAIVDSSQPEIQNLDYYIHEANGVEYIEHERVDDIGFKITGMVHTSVLSRETLENQPGVITTSEVN